MANFSIRSGSGAGNKTLIKGQDQDINDASYAIEIGDSGASTLHSATITNLTAGTVGSAVQLEDPAVTGWYCTLGAINDINSASILDFSDVKHLGSAHTESAGVITIGQAGWYFIMVTISNDGATGDTSEFYFQKNGTNSHIRGYVDSANELIYAQWSTSLIVDLAVNDTVAWYGNGNLYGATNANSMTNHVGYRIGK